MICKSFNVSFPFPVSLSYQFIYIYARSFNTYIYVTYYVTYYVMCLFILLC